MNCIRILYATLAILACNHKSLAQTQLLHSFTTAGGEASGINGSASFSIGQLSYSSFENANMQVHTGVQQAAVDHQHSFNVADHKKEVRITIYPNPVVDQLTITVAHSDVQRLEYQLYDIHGRLVDNNHLQQSQTTIALGYLQPATYLLKVLYENRPLKILKVIKN
ncbi:MAG TPA: T9SS type A sorting domain-containing protein [Leeuwenhoekiella sp.]|nr:T9SS type A sorting domain-containing protein [Leeuwenhoekiella sp.]